MRGRRASHVAPLAAGGSRSAGPPSPVPMPAPAPTIVPIRSGHAPNSRHANHLASSDSARAKPCTIRLDLAQSDKLASRAAQSPELPIRQSLSCLRRPAAPIGRLPPAPLLCRHRHRFSATLAPRRAPPRKAPIRRTPKPLPQSFSRILVSSAHGAAPPAPCGPRVATPRRCVRPRTAADSHSRAALPQASRARRLVGRQVETGVPQWSTLWGGGACG